MLGVLRGTKHIFWSLLTRGKDSQEFLGAKWIKLALGFLPESRYRTVALCILSLSPHYFFKTESNCHLNRGEFLESEFQRNKNSRRTIVEGIIKKYSRENQTVLDYGCGPGFMAHALSPYVKKIIGCDISIGVIACAGALNSASNIRYIVTPSNGEIPIGDSSVDLVYSFAVIQHITDDNFFSILNDFHRVLKNGGIVLCHIVVNSTDWRTEIDWARDNTMKGKLKWKYGLHCFGRATEDVIKMISNAGFEKIRVHLIKNIAVIEDEDIVNQHLFVFHKK